jgi:single-stranded DNA-binding protein
MQLPQPNHRLPVLWRFPLDQYRPMSESRATACLIGKLKHQPAPTYIAYAKSYVARSAIVTERCEIPIVATGELAERLSEYRAGTMLDVTGQIVLHQWKTGDNKPREQFEVEVEKVGLHESRKDG